MLRSSPAAEGNDIMYWNFSANDGIILFLLHFFVGFLCASYLKWVYNSCRMGVLPIFVSQCIYIFF
jgi:hypothetical protein